MAWPLVIQLTLLPVDKVRGIYTVDGAAGRMAHRLRLLHPLAAHAYLTTGMSEKIVVSDMYRSAESSLEAVKAGRGAKMPGYSAHNYGLAVDLDVEQSMRLLGGDKKKLDLWLEERGFFCHRRDHAITNLQGESHHFNFLGPGTVISPKFSTTSGYIEARIVELYGAGFKLSDTEAQKALAKLGLYKGEIDGIIGPRSRAAIGAFQRALKLGDTEILDRQTLRTLAFVTAEKS